MKNKKGNAQLQGLIISIVVIAIVLAVGLMVLVQFQQAAMVETKTATVVNETGAFLNRTGYLLSKSTSETFSNPAIVSAWNATDDTLIPVANYTLTASSIKNNTNLEYPDVLVTYTYKYYTKSSGYNSTGSIVTALTGIPTWISIIILVAIAGIILAAVLGLFGGKERSG